MRISVAQIKPVKGDIAANISIHQQLIELAVAEQVAGIYFPELSLTGYEPALAKDLAIHAGDNSLNNFQQLSDASNICIGIGMPLNTAAGIQISMFIFQPDRPLQVYAKQQLHEDELSYFVPGKKQTILTIDNTRIAPAICYESLQPNHAAAAHTLGAELYIASVAKSQSGVDKAMNHYPFVANTYQMAVLMSNCVGYCDNFESAGNTAAWTKQGKIAAQLNSTEQGLVIFDTLTEQATIQIVETS